MAVLSTSSQAYNYYKLRWRPSKHNTSLRVRSCDEPAFNCRDWNWGKLDPMGCLSLALSLNGFP